MNDPSDRAAETKPTKYFFGWIAAQTPLIVALIIGREQAQNNLVIAGAITAIWLGITSFLARVWKELEDDAVQSTARIIRSIPRTSIEFARRRWEMSTVWLTRRCFTRRYCHTLNITYGLFNDRGLGLINSNRLDLDSVYIELRASTDPQLSKPDSNPLKRDIRGSVSFWNHLRNLREGIAMVIIGVPGSGKTTLLQHVLLTFARNRQWRFRMRTRLPFIIPLHKVSALIAEGTETKPTPLSTVLDFAIESTIQGLGALPKKWLEHVIKTSRCLFLFDGLDEVADAVARKAVSAWVDIQIASPDNARHLFVVTARPLGYKEAPLARPHVLEVQPLSYDDSLRFIHRWYLANEIVSHGNRRGEDVSIRAKSGADDLISRLTSSARLADLVVNPLLLTMVCMIHRYQGALPGSRGELYQEIFQVLLERWRQSRMVQDSVRANQKLEVLRPLAAYLMEHNLRDFSLEDASVRAVIELPFELIGMPKRPPNSGDSLTAFFFDLQSSSGLVMELSSGSIGRWSFSHQTFQEFLCAEQWITVPSSAPLDFASLVSDPWWREVLLLYSARAKDSSSLASAALKASTEQAHSFAFAMMEEKPSLTPEVRADMNRQLIVALQSKNLETFLPAARAFLRRTADVDYIRVDQLRSISPWVSNAEYQLFLLAENNYFHTPLHWTGKWFLGSPQEPCVGIPILGGGDFCLWLDRTFPLWKHRLAAPSEVSNSGSGMISLGPDIERRDVQVYQGVRQIAFGFSLALHIAFDIRRDANKVVVGDDENVVEIRHKRWSADVHALALDIELAIARAFDLACPSKHNVEWSFDFSQILARTLTYARSVSLARAVELDRDLVHHAGRVRREALAGLRAFACDRDRAGKQAPNLARAHDRDRFLGIILDSGGGYLSPNELEQLDWVDFFQARRGWRTIVKDAIRLLRESHKQFDLKELSALEAFCDEIEYIQRGLKKPVECIRIIREHRR